MCSNLTLPHGYVLHDYVKESKESQFYINNNPLHKGKANEVLENKTQPQSKEENKEIDTELEEDLTAEKVLKTRSMPAIRPSYLGWLTHTLNNLAFCFYMI